MKRQLVLVLAVVLLCMVNIASADIVQGINIDFVHIGNAGNTADTAGYGAVGYDYQIGKYEVTNAQWNAFTLAAVAPTGNPITSAEPAPCAYHRRLAQRSGGRKICRSNL